MTNVIHNPRQVVLGSITLFIGIFVYVAFRPSWQAVWITDIISLEWREIRLYTEECDNLPSFLHVFGFSLLTSGFVVPKKWTYAIICGSWLFLNLLFEILQTNSAYTWLSHMFIDHGESNTLLHWLKNYSLQGVYDPKDTLALISGAVLAYFILSKTSKGG